MPVMLVIGDADGLQPSHAVEFFKLLGGGLPDANYDGSGNGKASPRNPAQRHARRHEPDDGA